MGASIALGFILLAGMRTEWTQEKVNTAFSVFGQGLGWLYFSSALFMAVISLFLLLSGYGSIQLGESEPEFSYFSYAAMFFTAGLGPGLLYFPAFEMVSHYDSVAPLFPGIASSTEAAIVPAMSLNLFHFSWIGWGAYLSIAIPIAYYAYNHGAPLRISTILYPVVGEEGLDGVWGRVLDILAVVATLGGIVTGLGFISSLLLSSTTYQFGVQFGNIETLLVITGLTIVFTVSVVLGIFRGIRRLANITIVATVLLLVVTLVFGPTVNVLNSGTAAFGLMIDNWFQFSTFTGIGFEQGGVWSSYWPIFYISFWIAWAPFVGLFISRISKGRTIREVVFTQFFVIGMFAFIWNAIFGGTAVWLQHTGAIDLLSTISEFGTGVVGYAFLGTFPLGMLWQLILLFLIITWFATSADSSTLALGMLTTGGKEDPSVINRIFWAVIIGLLASIMIILGGTDALRSSTVITGIPFAIAGIASFIILLWKIGQDHTPIIFQNGLNLIGSPQGRESTAEPQPSEIED